MASVGEGVSPRDESSDLESYGYKQELGRSGGESGGGASPPIGERATADLGLLPGAAERRPQPVEHMPA